MLNLGIMLSEGRPGVEWDYQAAAELFRAAIKRGSVEALWSLGKMISNNSEGVPEENMIMAVTYFQRAADQGQMQAASVIGHAYWKRAPGYEKNLKLAKKYMKVSASHGYGKAIADLKEMTSCAQCGTGSAPGVCAGCKQVHYCNKECQLQHWRSTHMPQCRKPSPTPAPKKSNCACASCGAHNATKLCSDCRFKGDPRRKVR